MYLHDDGLRHKAEGYCAFTALLDEDVGLYYACMWEVAADRNKALTCSRKTDQWIQPQGAVSLCALWVRVLRTQDLQLQLYVQPSWRPQRERNLLQPGDAGLLPIAERAAEEVGA